MVCKKCGAEEVTVNTVSDVKTKRRGCLGWCLWILLALCTCGLIIIIPLLTNSKTKTKMRKMCTCQKCGYSWEIK